MIGRYRRDHIKARMLHTAKRWRTISICQTSSSICWTMQQKRRRAVLCAGQEGKTSVIPRGSNKTVYVFRTDNTQMFSQSISTADMITRVKVVGKADDDGRTSVEPR